MSIHTNSLPDISEVTPFNEKDQPVLNELIAVLKKHDALNRFGVTLLHQHFDIGHDEILCESTDAENKTQIIKPIKKSELSSLDFTETSWRLDSGYAVTACICVKFGNDHQHHSRG